MKLLELFKSTYPFEVGDNSKHGWSAFFDADDGSSLEVNADTADWDEHDPDKIQWDITFTRDGRTTKNGKGDAPRIFATVIACLEKFVAMRKPKRMEFSALGDSRTDLYEAMVKRFAQKLGFTFKVVRDGAGGVFVLEKA